MVYKKARRVYRRKTSLLNNKMVVGAAIALAAPMIAGKVNVSPALLTTAGAYLTRNPVLVGYSAAQLIAPGGLGGMMGSTDTGGGL